MTKGTRIWLIVLSLLLAVSLAVNALNFYLLSQARAGALNALRAAQDSLRELTATPFTTIVGIDQTLPISATIPLDQTFVVPIDIIYPLDTVVHTAIQIPLVGTQNIAVPIQADIPIQMEIEIPIQMQIPISFTYHLQTEVPVTFELPSGTVELIEEILEQAEGALR